MGSIAEMVYVEESLGHICQFLDKPWFSRMWIIQEFVMGLKVSEMALLGNGAVVSFTALVSACYELSNWTINLPTAQRRALLTSMDSRLAPAVVPYKSKRQCTSSGGRRFISCICALGC
jgi:hypothetical protein